MSNVRFQFTLITPCNEPLYKTCSGLINTLIELSVDITHNVLLIRSLDIHIVDYKLPTIDELYDCWFNKVPLCYTIDCVNSQYNVEFRIAPKYD